VGIGVPESWASILAGTSGITRITRFDPKAMASQIAGEVKGFDVGKYLPVKEARRFDVFVHYGTAAAIEAIKDSGIEVTEGNAERIGVNIGSGIGGLPMIEQAHTTLLQSGPRRISPFFIPGTIINMVAGNLSIMYGFKGPNLAITTACTTSTHCVGEAARMIAYGDADAMVAGGSEATVSPLAIGGFCSARACC
jgi:3-oxoacyl-[acyl-carrier-protein] synthase II